MTCSCLESGISPSSEVFTCIDTVDEITNLLGLLDICLDKVQASSEVERHVELLLTSFLVQVKPELQALHNHLVYTDQVLRHSSRSSCL
jgi:hypothetical protein